MSCLPQVSINTSYILLPQIHCMHPTTREMLSCTIPGGAAHDTDVLGCRQILLLKSEVFCSLPLSSAATLLGLLRDADN